MTTLKSIAQILAELVIKEGTPLKAAALIGEFITIDARICDYPSGLVKGSLEDIEKAAESYELLQEKAETTCNEFRMTKDRQVLLKNLAALKDDINTLL